jgi:hypothetical protein
MLAGLLALADQSFQIAIKQSLIVFEGQRDSFSYID